MKEAQDKIRIWPSIRRLLGLAGKERGRLTTAIVMDSLSAITVIMTYHAMRNFFDAAAVGDDRTFWRYLWIGVIMAVSDIPLQTLRVRSIGVFSERTLFKIRQRVAEHIAVLPVSYLEARHSGDVLSVLNADLTKLQTLFSTDLLSLFGQTIRFVGALGYLLSISWPLTLVSTLMTPVAFFVISKLSQPMPERAQAMQSAIGEVNHVAQDSLGGLLISKVFNLTGVMEERYHQANARALSKGFAVARLTSKINIIGYAVSVLPFILTCSLGGYLVIQEQMSFGSLMAFINLLNLVANPLGGIPRTWASMGEAAGAAQRIFEILDHETERADGGLFQADAGGAAILEFQDAQFAYEAGKAIIRDVHIAIPQGQTVALVGPSGSGKSTLLKLMMGFYDLSDGNITLQGHDLKDWQLNAARQRMAYVAQDTILFPVSIAENIACGKLDASREEITRAAKAANLHDFITSLPEGYDTPVGERGARLSGGQRQRVALARAILRDAPILLLDEPTSALDTESEALVQAALDQLMGNRTIVVVAHRLSTIQGADRILVLDDGRIVQDGTHETLMAQEGLYRELYQRQFEATDAARNETYA